MIFGFDMNKLLYATLVAALLGASACTSPTPAPDVTISSITRGMTQTDVIKRIGPPDRMVGENGNECYQYALGKDDDVPFAVYFKQRVVAATQGPWYGGCISEKVAQAAWHAKPSSFVVATQDRMIDPKLQEAMAKRIGATVIPCQRWRKSLCRLRR